MKFINPVALTDAMLVASNVPETEYAAWAAGTTYALDAKAIKAHRIWQSVQTGNLGNDPTTDDGTWWIDAGPTNTWSMFDASVGTITSKASPITVSIAPGTVNSLALLDLASNSVQVTMLDAPAGSTVFDRTIALPDTAEIIDWYGYFFEDIVQQSALIVDDLPAYASGVITVTINASTTAACGTLAFGKMIELGPAQYGVNAGIIDYSRKETDPDFGTITVVERGYAKRFDANLLIENKRLDYVAKQLATVRAKPCVWVVSESYSILAAYGFYRDWSINIAYPQHSECSIQIEEVV